MSMVDILQLSKFYAPVEGGIESVVHELTESLVRRGFRLAVLCANTEPATARDSFNGYRVTRAKSYGLLFSTSLAPKLISILRSDFRRARIIHVHMPDPLAALAILAGSTKHQKVVVHWHSDVVNQKLARKLYKPLQNWLLRRADCVIATSGVYADASPDLQDFKSKIEVVPIGIQVPRPAHKDVIQRLKDQYSGRKIIFALGRHVYYKGFSTLISSAQHLPDNALIIIGGRGPLTASLEQQINSLGVGAKVLLLGRIPEEELSAYYSAADIFCLPSVFKSEAFGVVLLEAMAAGKPIVATTIPGSGVPWVNQHMVTGINVKPEDPVSLAAGLSQLLNDPELAAEMGEAGRRRFHQLFTAEAMVEKVAGIYEGLLGST